MGTRAIVGMKTDKGKYTSVYTHWDGNPNHHLSILVNCYNTAKKVKTLLSHGDISSLRIHDEGAAGHTFNTPVEDQTVYYGRDRGDEGTKAKNHTSMARFTQEEYGYLFQDGQWFVVFPGELVNHSEFLKNDEYQDERQD
jgi:hypothetical protein